MRKWPLVRHDEGHVIYILAIFVELLLMLALGAGLTLERALWARFEAYTALSSALRAAGSEVVLPVGPLGPQIDPGLAQQTFRTVLAADLPSALTESAAPALTIYAAGTTDPATGYHFTLPGLGGQLAFSSSFLGLGLEQTVSADVEVAYGPG